MASYPEQDQDGPGEEGELPTYDYLISQEEAKGNPNSRFGRWRGWVEKRAAERYNDRPRDVRQHRGWNVEEPPDLRDLSISPVGPSPAFPIPVLAPVPAPAPVLPPAKHAPFDLSPTHLAVHNFGSRFLPHATSPIRSVLPILGDRYLLVGDEEGLGMLDMHPEVPPGPDALHPLDSIKRKDLWVGEGVWQMSVLEGASSGDVNTPQGVVLFLIGTDVEGSGEPLKSVRMYNLASLVSLVRWMATQKDTKPLELHGGPPQQAPKRTKLTRGFRTSTAAPPPAVPPKEGSYKSPPMPSAVRADSGDTEASWDIIDDLPLRWATDFVSLAAPGSKLASSTVLFFELWKNDYGGRGTAMLAVATKTTILLYETPKGERAFRFVKEFYTPLPARKLTFIHQIPHENGVTRFTSNLSVTFDSGGRGSDSSRTRSVLVSPREPVRARRVSTPGDLSYGSQLSLFVIFEKKAGLIRISDSSVGELELFDDGNSNIVVSSPTTFRRSFQTFDAFGLGKEWKGLWVPPVLVHLPIDPGGSSIDVPVTRPILLLTRGKSTHILPSPLPVPLATFTPLRILSWRHAPSTLSSRLATPRHQPPYLQIVAFGEEGVEIQEISLSFLSKGKGKARADESLRAFGEAAEPSGLLCSGGHWHTMDTNGRPQLGRNLSTSSVTSLNPAELASLRKREAGIYGWSKRGLADWRVFWIGPSTEEPRPNRI